MIQLIAEMQTGYNGWSAYVDDGADCDTERELCDKIEDALPNITHEAYDDDGECVGDPNDYEREVSAKIAEIVGDREYNLTIKYDDYSS